MKLDDLKRRSNRQSALSLHSAAADFLLEYLAKYEPVVWSAQTLTFDLKSIYNTLELGHVTLSQYQKQRGTSL